MSARWTIRLADLPTTGQQIRELEQLAYARTGDERAARFERLRAQALLVFWESAQELSRPGVLESRYVSLDAEFKNAEIQILRQACEMFTSARTDKEVANALLRLREAARTREFFADVLVSLLRLIARGMPAGESKIIDASNRARGELFAMAEWGSWRALHLAMNDMVHGCEVLSRVQTLEWAERYFAHDPEKQSWVRLFSAISEEIEQGWESAATCGYRFRRIPPLRIVKVLLKYNTICDAHIQASADDAGVNIVLQFPDADCMKRFQQGVMSEGVMVEPFEPSETDIARCSPAKHILGIDDEMVDRLLDDTNVIRALDRQEARRRNSLIAQWDRRLGQI